MHLPRLYPIADTATLTARGVSLQDFARQVTGGGAEILQLRDKTGSPADVLRHAATMTKALEGTACLAVMNDRADLAVLAQWKAVHVGHLDLPPDAVRRVFGPARRHDVIVGMSTHNQQQVITANAGSADYVAIGPVFATGTKPDAEPVVGLEGLRKLCALTSKPVVAIGGISIENAAAVVDAGAHSVAVIGALFARGHDIEGTVRDFLSRLR